MRKNTSICVVVLGDIGRSPRMQYHSLSLAEHEYKVDIIGYGESQPLTALKYQALAKFHYLVPYPKLPCPSLLNYFLKAIWQSLTLLFLLIILGKHDAILVQNPPAIPALLICWFYSLLSKSHLIIDWHNYAYTIMALNTGENLLVKITKMVECFVGRRATNLCVTEAMKMDLDQNWKVRATTFYDCPSSKFQPLSSTERENFLDYLAKKYKLPLQDCKIPRGIVVSSTSWTEDEDFALLLKSLQRYEKCCKLQRRMPRLTCIITGKGPLKEYYCTLIRQETWHYVKIVTPWLENDDYPLLLGCADLGVCLHKSSSGFDLPMKVIDMFGCGLPVCAFNYKCLNELVQHGVNSYTFNNENELFQQLHGWFQDFPVNIKQNLIRKKFQVELQQFQTLRWQQNWNNIVAPIFK